MGQINNGLEWVGPLTARLVFHYLFILLDELGYMFQLVMLIINTLYVTIIIVHSFFVQVCSISKQAKSGLPMNRPYPTRLFT